MLTWRLLACVVCGGLLWVIASPLILSAADPVLPSAASPEAAPPAPAVETYLYLIKVNGKWGYIDAGGKVVIKPQFDVAHGFSEGLAAVNVGGTWVKEEADGGTTSVLRGGKWSYIDSTGKIVFDTSADSVFGFSESLAAIQVKDRWGFIDKTGKTVIQPQFATARPFSCGRAMVSLPPKEDEKPAKRPMYGYIDRTGRMVIPPQFPIAERFFEGLAVVVAKLEGWNADWGLIDTDGKFVVEPKYDWALPMSDGLAAVYTRDAFPHVEYVDRTGKVVCVAQGPDGKPLTALGMGIPWRGHAEEAREFHEGLAPFRVGAQEIHRSFQGKADLTMHGFYFEGGKWGFIDKTGKVVIQPQFDYAFGFSEGLVAVEIRTETTSMVRMWGYIDRTGKLVIKPQFSFAQGFRHGLAQVEIDDATSQERKFGYIDKTGKYVWEPTK
jgi:predicted DNA-binding WGR domain protein